MLLLYFSMSVFADSLFQRQKKRHTQEDDGQFAEKHKGFGWAAKSSLIIVEYN